MANYEVTTASAGDFFSFSFSFFFFFFFWFRVNVLLDKVRQGLMQKLKKNSVKKIA